MKFCTRCNENLSNSFFHKDNLRKDGLYPWCKSCRRKYSGAKEMIHKILGYVDGFMVTDARYPLILNGEQKKRVHIYIAEKMIGRKLKKGEVVHHIDGNKKNWNKENLQVLPDRVHRIYEGHKNKGYSPILSCVSCGKKKKYSNSVIKNKDIYPSRYQCNLCYYKSGGPGGRRKILSINPYEHEDNFGNEAA